MKVSKKFLNDYIDLEEINIKDLATKHVSIGNEVDEIKSLASGTNLVIGEILEKKPHPDSDHLNVCMVEFGEGPKQIICGADNFNVKDKVIVAKIGAVLPGDFKIDKRVVRGVSSNGMICSLGEIGVESKYQTEEDKNGIHVLGDDAVIGEDPIKYLEYDDEIIDFSLTSNRGDLLSMLGMAYETGAILNKKVNLEKIELEETKEKIKDYISIDNKTDNCISYKVRVVKNIKISKSPKWMRARLMACGIRPINNVVDISNYVMMIYGQPLHFFDYDKLGNKIIIRMAEQNEQLVTLDSIKRTLSENDIVIANPKEAVGLAGVMGGLSTEITNDTKNIAIEAAIFNPVNIRQTSFRILRSEASNRFEKGIDPNSTILALNHAAYLLSLYADGEIVEGVIEMDNTNKEDTEIKIKKDNITSVLGFDLSINQIEDIFIRLGFKVSDKNNIFTVNVPKRRMDILIKEDLIEEIGRIHGYDNMIGILPEGKMIPGELGHRKKVIREIKDIFESLGLSEAITYSLTNINEIKPFINDPVHLVEIGNPFSEDKKLMRYSILPSLLKVVDYNMSHNNKDVLLYEIGKRYSKTDEYIEEDIISGVLVGTYHEKPLLNEKITIDFYTVKGLVEVLLKALGLGGRYSFNTDDIPTYYHPGRSAVVTVDKDIIGYIGAINPNINKNDIYMFEFELDKILNKKVREIKYKESPKYPYISKDMGFILDKKIPAIDILTEIRKEGKKLLINAEVFDIYTGSNIDADKKSIAFNLIFQDEAKTLTEEEVNEIFERIIKRVENTFNATLRNK